MKKHTLLYLCSLLFFVASSITPAHAQQSKGQYALYNYRNDGCFNAWLNVDIEKITYSCIDTLGIEHDDVVVQEVWTPDSVYRIPLEAIDSIGFRAPEPEFASDIFYVRDYHATYTTSIDGFTIHFSNTIHRDSIPKVGQIVLSATDVTPYEEGFAGKVIDVQYSSSGVSIDCEAISIGDIYKRLVVVGKVSNDVETHPSNIKRRAISSEPWVNIEDNGVIPIDMEKKEFSIGDLVKITSPTPKLTCNYYVYISELYYEVFVKVDLRHPDLTYTFTLNNEQLSNFTEFGKLFLSQFSDEDALNNWIEEYKKKKIEDYHKQQKKDEEELSKKWFEKSKLTIPIPIPTTTVLNLELEISPIVKATGKFEISSEFKTDAWQSMSMKWKGFTPLKVIESNLGIPDIPVVSVAAHQDPFKSAKLDIKAKGALTFGFKTLLNANVIHKKLIYAGLACDFGLLEVGGTIDVTVLDSERPEMNVYDRLKDTNLKISSYAKGYAEVGLSPYKFLSASTPKAELYSVEKVYNILPHFTEPALPKFGQSTWLNKNPLSFYSTPSKDIYIPCNIGMRITDTEGKPLKEYINNNRFLDEKDWVNRPLEIDISDLPKGASYKCYPIISFFGWEPFNAGPVHNFSVPLSLVASPKELTIEVGKSGLVDYFGGWDTFAVVISGNDEVASIVNEGSTTARQVKILGKKVGKSELQIEDRRTGEKIKVPITVTNEPVPPSTISVSHTEIDFGTVSQGGTMKKRFKVTNDGESSITIQASCESTDFELSDNNTKVTLAKGESKDYIVTCNGLSITDDVNAVIIITSDGSSESQCIKLIAKGGGSSGDVPAEAVDLGLPSGTKWASYNVGASNPEDYGGYYAWGETEEKEEYSASTYQYCDGTEESCHNLGNSICGTKYDVATVKWGEGWQMPSHTQFEELINNCTQTITILNGVKGVRFTASNGNSIFIPAAGEHYGTETDGENDYGDYFTGTQYPTNFSVAYGFYFGYDGWGYEKKWNGHSIRPVYVENNEDYQAEVVDLGLPSGTKWASCNVGATKPEEYGRYYAWGETVEKDYYNQSNYSLSAVGNAHTLSEEEDVATMLLGEKWRMPTMDEFKELLNFCSWTWEELEGVNGARITGPNGNSIFMPAASFRENNGYGGIVGEYGSYWGRTNASSVSYATELVFGTADYKINYQTADFYFEMGPTGTRYSGRSVRPVSTEKNISGINYTSYIVNSTFDGNDYSGWDGTMLDGVNPDNNAEHFNKNYDTYQVIVGLPAGKYLIEVQGFYRKGRENNDYALWQSRDTENNNAIIYAQSSVGSYSVPFVSASSAALKESLGGNAAIVGDNLYIPNDMVAAGAWFNAGYYKNQLEVEVGTDGKLIIGIKKNATIYEDWTIIDNWMLFEFSSDFVGGGDGTTGGKQDDWKDGDPVIAGPGDGTTSGGGRDW